MDAYPNAKNKHIPILSWQIADLILGITYFRHFLYP